MFCAKFQFTSLPILLIMKTVSRCIHSLVLLVFIIFYSCAASQAQHVQHEHKGQYEHINSHLGKFVSSINVSIDSVVDAKLHDLSRVYHSGNICPFRRTVIDKMVKSEKIKIVIAGGSVTYGADLKNRLQERWSTYFSELMNSGWYAGQFEIVNIGVGACNIDVWLLKVGMFKDADLVIMDLSVNDQGFDLQALPHLYHTFIQLVDALPNHPALLFHQAFRTGLRDPQEFGHCPIKEYQGTCCNGFLWCKRWWDMQDFVAIPLTRFGVPFVSYRDLVWPVYDSPPPVLDQWWNGMSHPDRRAHKMMAKLIAFGVMMQVKEAHTATHCDGDEDHTRYVSSTQIDATIQPICATALTALHPGETLESVETFPAQLEDGRKVDPFAVPPVTPWRFLNDSQLKFGWILEVQQADTQAKCGGAKHCPKATEESTLSFKLNFGASPRLQISFLKSQGVTMGTIMAWMDDKKDEILHLQGWWDLPYSVIHTVTISNTPLVNISATVVGDAALFPSLTAGEHTLHLALPSHSNGQSAFKWKLLGITTC